MADNLPPSSIRIFRNARLAFDVLLFNWYSNILGSGFWKFFRKPVTMGRRSYKFLLHIASNFADRHSPQKNIEVVPALPAAQNRQPEQPLNGTQDDISAGYTIMGEPLPSKLSIIFVHYSNSDYLRYSLSQAKHSNPQSTIYLLGDDTNRCYDFIEHRFYQDYFQGAKNFSKIYRHFNTTPYKHELFCFQRWFILRDFMVTSKLSKCLYLDSDTMLYSDVTEEQTKFAHFDFTLSYKTSGATFFLNNVAALTNFCRFLTDIYTKKERVYFDRMLAQYAIFRKNGMPGGACDMTAFDFYSYEKFGEIGEVAQIIDGSVFDPSLNVSHPGFEMANGIKKVIWKHNHPFGIHLRTGHEIKFNSLQFQGATKQLMEQYHTGTAI